MSEIRPYTAADLERLKSVHSPPQGGWTHATQDQVLEYRDEKGDLVKVTLDQLGHQVRMRKRGQDVRINLGLVSR